MNIPSTAMITLLVLLVAPSFVEAQPNRSLVQSRFETMDKNGDGEITASEVERPFMIRRFDTDSSGSLSVEEFRRLFELAVSGRKSTAQPGSDWKASSLSKELPADAWVSRESILSAAKYSAEHDGISFLVLYDGDLIYADYPNGGSADRNHELASGTKSFTGVLAMVAIEDGIIESLDEKVCDTITSWKTDPRKSKITVRHLLNLTSGIHSGNEQAGQVPSYADAIENRADREPGESFQYGPAHFQCFGEFLRLKLLASDQGDPGDPEESVLMYLERRIFDPIGLKHGPWRTDRDGNPHLPSGARLTANEWAKFGELVRRGGRWGGRWGEVQVVQQESIDACLVGSSANPAYGLTFWLNASMSAEKRRSIRQLRFGTDDLTTSPKIPTDLVFAAGAGKQRMFVSRDAKLVVVRQATGIVDSLEGRRGSYSDADFLNRLFVSR